MSSDILIDAAAQRREARRRKILENSEKRMKIITAVQSETSNTELKCHLEESFYNKNSANHLVNSENLFKSDLNFPIESFNYEMEEDGLPPQSADPLQTGTDNAPGVKNIEESVLLKIIQRDEFHFIGLALAVLLAFYLNLLVHVSENILYPFATLELVKLPSKLKLPSTKPFLITALFMLRAPSRNLNIILEVVFHAVHLTKDLCLYLFVFVFSREVCRTFIVDTEL